MKISVKDIEKQVRIHLESNGRIDAREIRVESRGDAVRLSGTVPNYPCVHRAAEEALAVGGVSHVENDLTVKYPPAQMPVSDANLQDRINSLLQWDAETDAKYILVRVDHARVFLKGSVEDLWSRIRAGKLAGSVRGVYKVINELAVIPSGNFDDQAIASDIEAAFSRHSLLAPDQINLTIVNGEVTLEGLVDSRAAFGAVENIVFHTAGVLNVINQLGIRSC